MTHMGERVGVRALQQHASEVLRRIAAGEVVEITDRGRHVATMSAPVEGTLAALIATGQARPARRGLRALPEPVVLDDQGATVSDLLAEARRHER